MPPLSDMAAKPETGPDATDDGMEYEEVVKENLFSNRPYQKVNLLRAAGLIPC